MKELAKLAIETYGGLERWNSFTTLSAHLIQGGVLWAAKGKAGVLDDVTVTVDLTTRTRRWPRRGAFLDRLPLSPADRARIAHGNAERLLGL